MRYPFNEMRVGDSFVSPGKRANATFCKAVNASKSYAARHGVKFTARLVEENTVRIWRIE